MVMIYLQPQGAKIISVTSGVGVKLIDLRSRLSHCIINNKIYFILI